MPPSSYLFMRTTDIVPQRHTLHEHRLSTKEIPDPLYVHHLCNPSSLSYLAVRSGRSTTGPPVRAGGQNSLPLFRSSRGTVNPLSGRTNELARQFCPSFFRRQLSSSLYSRREMMIDDAVPRQAPSTGSNTACMEIHGYLPAMYKTPFANPHSTVPHPLCSA